MRRRESYNDYEPNSRPDFKEEEAPHEDLVRQYLKEIGEYELLTAADEVALAKTMEAGVQTWRIHALDITTGNEIAT